MDKNNDIEQKELLEKAFFSYVGYHHTQNILSELEDHIEEIQAIEIPETLDKKVYKSIQEIENSKKSKVKKLYDKMLRTRAHKAAAIFIILSISMAVLTVSVEAFRVRVFNIVLEQKEKYLEIRMDEDYGRTDEVKLRGHYVPGYIPEGFELESTAGSGDTATLFYINENNQQILFDQSPNKGTTYQLDSEDAIREDITINGYKGISLTKGERVTLFWSGEETSFVIIADIEYEELIKMAESITKNK